MHVMSWIAMGCKLSGLKDWVLMQGIKESSTLRIGPKGDKPSPRIVYRFGSQNERVAVFLSERRVIKRICRRVNEPSRESPRVISSGEDKRITHLQRPRKG